jgi:hydroxymethylpyrimidine kinase/phosphomethylpyrimidine kinase
MTDKLLGADVGSVPRSLTIAGSDSGGGAGIQADLKTMTSLGVFGTSALTAITAQNTVGVQGVTALEPGFVAQQITSVLDDIGTDSVKIGMLFSADIINAVCETLEKYKIENIVVDPVMVATQSRRPLLSADAVDTLKKRLLPMALIVTPNAPEAEVISGKEIATLEDMRIVAQLIHTMGPKYVLLKGGHVPLNHDGKPVKDLSSSEAVVVDLLYDGKTFHEYKNDYVKTDNTHGTGCTLSAAIASYLAKGESGNII